LFYFWRGDDYSERDTAFSGIGVFTFRHSKDTGVSGPAKGWYTAGALQEKLEVTGKQIVELRRASPEDCKVMSAGDSAARSRLVRERYAQWSSSFGRRTA
jgi:hypothetical protein